MSRPAKVAAASSGFGWMAENRPADAAPAPVSAIEIFPL
jgi:hypothetical protein